MLLIQKRSLLRPIPPYYDRYINLVDDVGLAKALTRSEARLDTINVKKYRALAEAPAPDGKWTIKENLQHLIDVERILSYRALRFARGDGSPSPGFDPDELVRNSQANLRTIDDLILELKTVRRSTTALFRSFDDQALQRTGTNWQYEMSVLAMGFTIVGHQVHHLGIIEGRYFKSAL